MTQHESTLVRASLTRCETRPGFFDRFYELFMASSEEVAKKFQFTEFEKQKEMLKDSLYMMLVAEQVTDHGSGHDHLRRLAKRHSSKDLDIRPGLYDLWLDCLIRAVEEFDPLFSQEIEDAWRGTMKVGIEFMRARY